MSPIAAALKPWGRDGGGTWTEDTDAGLCHALTILTPEDAFERQPLHSADGGLVLVAACRLDNRDELAASCGIRASDPEIPDSAYVLAAYQRWGAECVHHLLGAFRVVIWDRQQRRLWAAVDHLGEYTLFFHRGSRQVVIGSSIPAVLAGPNVPRRADLGAWTRQLVDALEPDQTCLEGIEHLTAGRTLTIDSASHIRVHRYWRPDKLAEPLRLSGPDDLTEAFSDVFSVAVTARLRSAGSVGSFCSGGLDSTTVAATAAQALRTAGKRLPTFTSVPSADWTQPSRPGWDNSDEPYVRALARMHPNLDPAFCPPDGSIFLDHLDRVHATTGSPFRNALSLPWLQSIDDQAASRELRVLLTGQAGNATISWAGGSPVLELLRRRQLGAAWHEAKTSGIANATQLPRLVLAGVAPRAVLLSRERRRRGSAAPWDTRAALNPGYADDALDRHAIADLYLGSRTADGRRLDMLYRQSGLNLLRDSTVARSGLIHRDPTADLRVVQFCLRLPVSAFATGGGHRLLVRRTTADLLPPEIRLRTTRGEQAPDAFGQLAPRQRDLSDAVELLATADATRELLDIPRLRRVLADLPNLSRWQDRGALMVFARTVASGLFLHWVQDQPSP